MSYALVHADVVIGYSDLEDWDEEDSMASGALRPTAAYEPLRQTFRAPTRSAVTVEGVDVFAAKLASITALGLELRRPDGAALPVRQVIVQDLTEPGQEGSEADAPWMITVAASLPQRLGTQ